MHGQPTSWPSQPELPPELPLLPLLLSAHGELGTGLYIYLMRGPN
jgi:hypothetical protein